VLPRSHQDETRHHHPSQRVFRSGLTYWHLVPPSSCRTRESGERIGIGLDYESLRRAQRAVGWNQLSLLRLPWIPQSHEASKIDETHSTRFGVDLTQAVHCVTLLKHLSGRPDPPGVHSAGMEGDR